MTKDLIMSNLIRGLIPVMDDLQTPKNTNYNEALPAEQKFFLVLKYVVRWVVTC